MNAEKKVGKNSRNKKSDETQSELKNNYIEMFLNRAAVFLEKSAGYEMPSDKLKDMALQVIKNPNFAKLVSDKDIFKKIANKDKAIVAKLKIANPKLLVNMAKFALKNKALTNKTLKEISNKQKETDKTDKNVPDEVKEKEDDKSKNADDEEEEADDSEENADDKDVGNEDAEEKENKDDENKEEDAEESKDKEDNKEAKKPIKQNKSVPNKKSSQKKPVVMKEPLVAEEPQETTSYFNSRIAPNNTDTQNVVDYNNNFNINAYINAPLFSVISVLVYIISIITIFIIFINSFMNYALFCYFTINQAILESDEFNVEKIRINDTYNFKLLNYIYCYQNATVHKDEAKLKDAKALEDTCKNIIKEKSNTTYDYVFNLLAPLDECDKEPYINILGGNKLYTFAIKLIFLIIIIIFIGVIIYILVSLFLGGLRNYNILGNNMFTYLYQNGMVYMMILLLVLFYCIIHGVLFKYMFTENVYNRLYNNYLEMLKLDSYVHGELKSIENEKDFVNTLTRSTLGNIDIGYETNLHNTKIINNIKNSSSDDVKAAKIFVYTVYIYLKRQNTEDINIINTINDIITQKPENTRTIRSLLLLKINDKQLSADLNDVVTRIGYSGMGNQDFQDFDYNNMSSYNENSLKYKIAFKMNKFFDILVNMGDKIDFIRVVYYLNLYLVFEWLMNVVFILLFLLVLYFYSEKDPLLKRVIDYVVIVLITVIDELKTGLIGI